MPFKEIPGLPGKVYIPEQSPDAPKKHSCPDCFCCQMCSDSRCRVCRRQHIYSRGQNSENASLSPGRPFIVLKNITVRTGEKPFFKNLSWEILADQHWAVIGPTGAGKSLLVKAIQRKVPLADGVIQYYFDGQASGKPRARGYLERGEILRAAIEPHETESYHQARWHSMETEASARVSDYLNPANIQKRSPYEIIGHQTDAPASLERRDMLLEQMSARDLLNRRMIHLSNGEFRKIKIVRALMQSPKLLILENPLAGLDSATRKAMEHILEKLLASFDTKIMLVTSTAAELPAGITHALCISDKQILAKGKKDSVLSKSCVQAVFAGNQCRNNNSIRRLPAPFRPLKADEAPLVVMKKVSIRYQGTTVLKDITWQMRTGEHWAILGPNGAGKSTLLSLVLADNPQAYANDIKLFGKYRGGGESIWEIKQHMGWVAPELQRAYSRGGSCLQVVCSGFFDSIGLYQKPDQEQLDAAAAWMHAMGLDHLPGHLFHSASEGEQRLVLICRALVKRPQLLILDEPCLGLDNCYRGRILNLLDGLCRQGAAQLLYVTHRLAELPDSITHVLKLENGQITAKGRRCQILDEFPPVDYEGQ